MLVRKIRMSDHLNEDTVKRLPPKTVEITAFRPSDLPAIDPRQVEIKPTDELYRITGATLLPMR